MFAVIYAIVNGIDILINGMNHWIGSMTEMLHGYMDFFFAVTTGLYSETKFDWGYFGSGIVHFGSAFQIQIALFVVTIQIVLSDLSVQELVQYANDWYSDTKQRYTDLFEVPNIIEIESSKQKRYFEEKLIHKTSRGEMVRSKSELIVANILDNMKIEYSYEESLTVGNKTYIPDFTLRYKGKTCYLEHLGMRGDKLYEKRWKEKQANYESAGISEAFENLIITEDGLDGSLDATLIESKIQTWIKKC